MTEEKDIEKTVDTTYFVATLRRIADAVEAGEAFRIQVKGDRTNIPKDATLAVAYEVEEGEHELELELTWKD